MYSQLVLDHLENPRNVGRLPGASATSRVTNPGCGDQLELSLRVDHGVVVEARFLAQGCTATLACASCLTELVRGRPVAEARSLTRDALLAALRGLPATSHHAAQLSIDALRAALGPATGR